LIDDPQRERERQNRRAPVFAVAAILVVLIATLTPGDTDVEPFTACIICGSQGIADAICNIALFLPVGAALVFMGVRPSRAVLLAAALSAFVEGMQATVIAGRDPSLGDVVFNTLGGLFGALAAGSAPIWVTPRRRHGRVLASAAMFGACTTVAVTGLMLEPAFEQTAWYGQWTPNFGNTEIYRGQVLGVRVGGSAIPSRRLYDGGAMRRALIGGDTLVVRVRSSPITHRIAVIFSVYDDRQSQQFLLGANGTALDLYVRRRTNDARLVNPPLRFGDALSGVAGGDTLTVEVRRAGRTWCAGRIPLAPCHGFSAGAGWQLLQDIGVLRRHARLIDALWLFGLLVPAGYWLRGRGGVLGGLATLVLACAVVPATCGLLVSPPTEWAGATAGLLGGNVLATLMRRLVAEVQ
jgi:hypothetical protein